MIKVKLNHSLEVRKLGWRDGSILTSSGCSCRDPKFDCQHPQWPQPPSVTPVPDAMLLLASGRTRHTGGAGKTAIYIIYVSILNLETYAFKLHFKIQTS